MAQSSLGGIVRQTGVALRRDTGIVVGVVVFRKRTIKVWVAILQSLPSARRPEKPAKASKKRARQDIAVLLLFFYGGHWCWQCCLRETRVAIV